MGENHFAAAAHRALRRGAADGRDRLLDPAAPDHRVAGPGLAAAAGRGRRLEGQPVTAVYIVAIAVASVGAGLAGCSTGGRVIWLVPDRRIERVLH